MTRSLVPESRRRALFATAIPCEYSAVRGHLTNVHEEVHEAETVYEVGDFQANSGEIWDVAVFQTGAGNVSAALEAERAIRRYRPSLGLFCGVAGGVKDVALGDVVAATKVYAYESQKVTREFLPRPNVGRSSYPLVQRAKAEARRSNWLARINGGRPGNAPRALVGPIAAGEKVVASASSDVARFLRRYYSDALAVEMEGSGFLEAVYANCEIQSMVVRGMSDLLSNKQRTDGDGWQETAAENAAAFAFQLLASWTDGMETESTKWSLVLSGTIDEMKLEQVKAIIKHLRGLSDDSWLTLERIEPGSVTLVFHGTVAGYQRIDALYRAGMLPEVMGLHVKEVRTEPGSADPGADTNGCTATAGGSSADIESRLAEYLAQREFRKMVEKECGREQRNVILVYFETRDAAHTAAICGLEEEQVERKVREGLAELKRMLGS